MDFNMPPIGGPDRTAATPPRSAPAQRTAFGASLDAAAAVSVSTLPASPPDEVLAQMSEAGRVAAKLHALGRELHFEPTGTGRVVVEVRDLEGNVLRTVPPSTALEIAAGAPLDS